MGGSILVSKQGLTNAVTTSPPSAADGDQLVNQHDGRSVATVANPFLTLDDRRYSILVNQGFANTLTPGAFPAWGSATNTESLHADQIPAGIATRTGICKCRVYTTTNARLIVRLLVAAADVIAIGTEAGEASGERLLELVVDLAVLATVKARGTWEIVTTQAQIVSGVPGSSSIRAMRCLAG